MKPSRFLIASFISLTFIATSWAQQTAPAPQPAPAPQQTPAPAPQPGAQTSPPPTAAPAEIPVIRLGDQVKPEKEKPKPEEAQKPEKVVKKQPKRPPVEVPKTVSIESKQLVHSKVSQVGNEVIFVVGDNPMIPKGSLILGKISEIERMQKDEPGRIKINLSTLSAPSGASTPLTGTVEAMREKDKDSFGGKEMFILPGSKFSVPLPKKPGLRAAPRSKTKPLKGLLSASAEMEQDHLSIKIGNLRYPARVGVYIEPPSGLKITDLNEDSLRIIRINDLVLPTPIRPSDEKIKVADHNKNNIQDMRYSFIGWDVIQYFPQGSSRVVFSASTKDGRPIEAMATVTVDYQ
jgi:hypothetical protein